VVLRLYKACIVVLSLAILDMYSVNFNKITLGTFLFKNATEDSYRLVTSANTKNRAIILKPGQSYTLVSTKKQPISVLSVTHAKNYNPAIFYVFEDETAVHYTIQNRSDGYDCFHIDFDKALNAKSAYYQDCIQNKLTYYDGTISSQWYKASLAPGVEPREFIDFVKKIYNTYFFNCNGAKQSTVSAKNRIPKMLHQIWIGPKPLPKQYQLLREKWCSMNSHWRHKLWTDSDLEHFAWSTPEIKKIFDQSTCYATKADILRMEILYKWGGVYVDLDTEPLEPLDSLSNAFDFFGLLYGPDKGTLVIDVFFLGATVKHPIIKQTLDNIVSIHTTPPDLSHLTNDKKFVTIVTHAVMPLTQAFWQQAGKDERRDIVLPIMYFNNYIISSVSYGVHYPQRSWMNN
jgi:Glycosyltransferase sugar-binding region containing DXD motif